VQAEDEQGRAILLKATTTTRRERPGRDVRNAGKRRQAGQAVRSKEGTTNNLSRNRQATTRTAQPPFRRQLRAAPPRRPNPDGSGRNRLHIEQTRQCHSVATAEDNPERKPERRGGIQNRF
jgi:hypothetical protein